MIFTGEPTYCITDKRRLPDIFDFVVVKGTSPNLIKIQSSRFKAEPEKENHKNEWKILMNCEDVFYLLCIFVQFKTYFENA